jgi:putative tricarboxylic transport membrane protein
MDSRKDVLVALFVIALGVAVILVTMSFPEPLIHDTVGPRAFPYGIGIIFIFGGSFVAFQRLRRMNVAGGYRVPSEGTDDEPGHPASGLRGMAMIALAFAYAAVLNPLGFVVATPIFLIAAFLLLRERRWISILASAVLYTAITYLVFGRVLNVRLPPGLLTGILP